MAGNQTITKKSEIKSLYKNIEKQRKAQQIGRNQKSQKQREKNENTKPCYCFIVLDFMFVFSCFVSFLTTLLAYL